MPSFGSRYLLTRNHAIKKSGIVIQSLISLTFLPFRTCVAVGGSRVSRSVLSELDTGRCLYPDPSEAAVSKPATERFLFSSLPLMSPQMHSQTSRTFSLPIE